jgi:uracil phosphoribosyltransferase
MNYNNINIVTNPLLQHHIAIVRNRETKKMCFQNSIRTISQLLFAEASKELELKSYKLETPVSSATGFTFKKPICLVPILRAGLSMVEGIEKIFSDSIVGMIGVKRDEESLEAIHYYENLPKNLSEYSVFLLDPMLATGGSALYALEKLHEKGAKPIFLNIISVDKGLSVLNKKFPNLKIYTASIDEVLNDKAYILPGLGDAGDRYFGT